MDPILADRLSALEQSLERARDPSGWKTQLDLHNVVVEERIWGWAIQDIKKEVNRQVNELRDIREMSQDNDHVAAAWRRYNEVHRASEGLFRDCLELIGGLALRDKLLDDQICQLTDELIVAFADAMFTYASPSIPAHLELPPRTLRRVVRMRFPEWTIWTLSLAAHEYGHIAIGETDELANYSLQRAKEAAELGSDDAEDPTARAARLERMKRCAEVLIADAFATYTLGPAYACPALLLQFNPLPEEPRTGPGPFDLQRAELVLGILEGMGERAAGDNVFQFVLDELRSRWDQVRKPPENGGPIILDPVKVLQLFRTELGDIRPAVRYPTDRSDENLQGGWLVAKEWEAHWQRQIDEFVPPLKVPANVSATSKLRDALNAAWLCQLKTEPEMLPEIERAARDLCQQIISSRLTPKRPRSRRRQAQVPMLGQVSTEMNQEFPQPGRFGPQDRGQTVTSRHISNRLRPAWEADELRDDLARARREAASGQLAEASDILSALINRLQRSVTRGEEAALSTPQHSDPASAGQAGQDSSEAGGAQGDARTLTGSVWAVRGDVEGRAGRQESAQAAFARAVSYLEPPGAAPSLEAHELSDFGMALVGIGRLGEAIEALRQAIQLGAATAQSFRYLGLALHGAGHTGEAERALGQAVQIDADDPWLLSDLAGIIATTPSRGSEAALRYCDAAARHAAAGRPDSALDEWDKALAADGSCAPAWRGKAGLLILGGRPAEALGVIDLALQVIKNDLTLRSIRAEALRVQGSYQEALAELDPLLAESPGDPWLAATKGWVLSAQGDQEQAIGLLRAALDGDPSLSWARQALADALRVQGSYQEALAELDPLLAESPGDPWGRAKGQVLSAQGDQEQAIGLLRAALDGDPSLSWARRALAEALRVQGSYQEALAELDPLLAESPGDPWLAATKGWVLSAQGDQEQAIGLLRAALDGDPSLSWARRALADALRVQGSYQEALAELDPLLAESPGDPWLAATKGQVLSAQGDQEQAIGLLRAALDGDPSLSWARRALADALRVQGSYQEALAELDPLLAESPGDPWTLAAKGQVLSAQGDQEQAIGLLRAALDGDPSLSWARRALAEALRVQGSYQEALAELDPLLAESPGDPWLAATKGWVLSAQGDQEQAIGLLRAALDGDPSLSWARRALADALRVQGSYQEALAELDPLLAESPGDPWLAATKGWVLSAQGDQEQAIGLLRAALDGDPSLSWARRALAEALRVQGSYQEALAELDPLLAESPGDPWLAATKGQVLSAQGDQEQAIGLLRAALDGDPSLSWARRALAEALRVQGSYQEALAELDPLLAESPGDPWALATKGLVLLAKEQPEQTAALLQPSAEESESAFLHAVLAEALRVLGNTEAALDEFDRAVALDANDAWTWASRGAALQEAERFDAALTAFDKALALDPGYGWAMSAKASALIDLAEYQTALKLLEAATQAGEVSDWTLALKGDALSHLGQHGMAVAAYREATTSAPNTPNYHAMLGEALLIDGQRDQANAEFQWFLRHKDEHTTDQTADLLGWTGWVHYRLTEYRDAIANYSEALSIKPRQIYTRFDIGLTFLCFNQEQLAMETYERGVEDAGSLSARRRHGLFFVAQFDLEDARARYHIDDALAARIDEMLTRADHTAASEALTPPTEA